MFKPWVLSVIICCAVLQIFGNNNIGPGLWQVHYVKQCDVENELFKFEVQKKKINRTHDGYSGTVKLNVDYTKDYGILVDICKHVDGGCKHCQTLADESSVNFYKKFAGNNVKACLELIGIDPPDFPITKGEYSVENYVVDYRELPENGGYGLFGAMAYLLEGAERVSCLELLVEFKEKDECEDDDCDDDDEK